MQIKWLNNIYFSIIKQIIIIDIGDRKKKCVVGYMWVGERKWKKDERVYLWMLDKLKE